MYETMDGLNLLHQKVKMIIENKEDVKLCDDFFDQVKALIPEERIDIAASALTNLLVQICSLSGLSRQGFLMYMGTAFDLNSEEEMNDRKRKEA
jgi:hypothetical protein